MGTTLGCVAWPDMSSPGAEKGKMGPRFFFILSRGFQAQGCVLQGFLGSGAAIQCAPGLLPDEGLGREIQDYLCLFLCSGVTGPLYKCPACSYIVAVAVATSGFPCWQDCPSGISPRSTPIPQGSGSHKISGQWSHEVCSFSLPGLSSLALPSESWLWPSSRLPLPHAPMPTTPPTPKMV